MSVNVRVADVADLEQLAVLFDEYRQFYAQPSDLGLARRFMRSRLSEGDSLVLVAENEGTGVAGFTQLYPLFDSVSTCSSFILYDLYVNKRSRRSGLARALMVEAVEQARRRGAGRVMSTSGRKRTSPGMGLGMFIVGWADVRSWTKATSKASCRCPDSALALSSR
ncbi:GNAT family N-acetyltransferase [Stenotrophomonas maltophilia]|uniref:GNAT family N-acetyltransferase n=1 Tax=Stenotrophomonas maltophilia TaxID=40324 RepID=A0AA40XX21_STEMA|nr:GNAT family N-acetyltransferase [Stenotrophomonas maltophilia]